MSARKNASVNETIIDSAFELFAFNGLHGTSLSDIAKLCGISKGTLYYYFPNKENLISICSDRCIQGIGDSIFSWLNALGRSCRIEEACDGLVSIFVLGDPAIRLMTELFTHGTEDFRERMTRTLEEWRVMLEVAAMKLSGSASQKLSKCSCSVLSMLIGFAVCGTTKTDACEALLQFLSD